MLNLSQNRLDKIQGLKTLGGLIALNLDNNGLSDLGLETRDGGDNGARTCLGKLRILRVSGNRLQRLDGECFPNLRTLYADNNALTGISHCGRMRRLENLSVRNQAKGKLSLSLRDVRDVKRLYLSGNPLSCRFMTESCYNLVYFELAACRLTSLPSNFSSLVPNVRVLNLNYNFLEDVGPLEGLSRMRKLSIIGSRVKGTKGLIRMVQRMGEIEMVDFRYETRFFGQRAKGTDISFGDEDVGSSLQMERASSRRERERFTQLEFRDAGLIRCVGAKAN